MSSRLARVLSAALVVALGVFAFKRAGDTEAPVAPGTWDPVD